MKQKTTVITDTELIDAYRELKNLSKIAAKFQVPQVSIWRRCKMLGITFGHNSSGKEIPLNEILEGLHPHFQSNKLRMKLLKTGVFENKCSCCGISDWQDRPLTLQLDHINGINSDHRLENLRMLCPNCHSQTDTWCGKNK